MNILFLGDIHEVPLDKIYDQFCIDKYSQLIEWFVISHFNL